MTLESLALQGRPRTYSSLAASVTNRIDELRKELIKESLLDSHTGNHKMDLVANIHGIEFINDSRACTINSTWYALENMNSPVIWITGGGVKGTDYSAIKELIISRVKVIICLGKSNQKILKTFNKTDIPIIQVTDMNEAVDIGYHLGKKGDAVLLSPGCASFDMFENFEERGEAFRKSVAKL